MNPEPKQLQTPDEELLCAIVQGDKQAFASLYDRYSSTLFGFLLRILSSRTEAEDVLQEVFLQVWQQASNYDDTRGRPFTWLVLITRSRAIDRLRAINVQDRTLAKVSSEMEEMAFDVTDDAARSEQCEMVRRALVEIPEEQQQALFYAYFEGLTQAEIAEKTRKPIGTVKTRTRSGLRKLRELLREKIGTGHS